MRILLQDPETNLYFQYPNAWVVEAAEAFAFASSSDVEQWHRLLGMFDGTLVFRFDEEGYSIRVPLHSSGEAGGAYALNGDPGLLQHGIDADATAARP